MKSFNKKALLILVPVLCLLLAGSAFSYLRFREAHYFGRVSELREKSFLIEDKKIGSREIWVNDETKIVEGRNKREDVLIGERVIVIGQKDVEGKIVAKDIRVFKEQLKK
jgi:hypothetical protein